MMINQTFDFQHRIRLVFGVGASNRLGEYAKELGGNRILLVSDPGVVRAGHIEHAVESLEQAGLNAFLFDRVIENPTTDTVDQCVEYARNADIDFIIGFGGGSALDTAKGCNFILTNGGTMCDYWGVGKAQKPMLPLIAVPTTAGTGSECQSFALISDAKTHQKMACGDPKAAPKLSILDPALTVTQPSPVAARTGVDSIAHAIESAVTTKRNPISWLYSKEALRLTLNAFPKIFKSPEDLNARGEMLLGAAYAGTAIENSMLGSAHAAANPLTANYSIGHGQAVGLMLPHIIRFNTGDESVRALYRDLAIYAGAAHPTDSPESAAESLVQQIEKTLDTVSLSRSLEELNIKRDAIPALAQQAAEQWTGKYNPRQADVDDYIVIYEQAYAASSL